MQDLAPPRTWPAWVLAGGALAVLWMPAMRGFAWGVLWVAYLAGTSPEPPPGPSHWMLW